MIFLRPSFSQLPIGVLGAKHASNLNFVGYHYDNRGKEADGADAGPVMLLRRSRCSFKRQSFQKPRGFSSPMLSVFDADYRTH